MGAHCEWAMDLAYHGRSPLCRTVASKFGARIWGLGKGGDGSVAGVRGKCGLIEGEMGFGLGRRW